MKTLEAVSYLFDIILRDDFHEFISILFSLILRIPNANNIIEIEADVYSMYQIICSSCNYRKSQKPYSTISYILYCLYLLF